MHVHEGLCSLAHICGMDVCTHLRVKRGLLVVVYAECVKKQSDCENLTLCKTLKVSCLFWSLRSKLFEQIELCSSCKNRKGRESMIHVMEDRITPACTYCFVAPMMYLSANSHSETERKDYSDKGCAVTKDMLMLIKLSLLPVVLYYDE